MPFFYLDHLRRCAHLPDSRQYYRRLSTKREDLVYMIYAVLHLFHILADNVDL